MQGGILKAVALGCDVGKSISRSWFSANVREVLGQTLLLWVTPGAAGVTKAGELGGMPRKGKIETRPEKGT